MDFYKAALIRQSLQHLLRFSGYHPLPNRAKEGTNPASTLYYFEKRKLSPETVSGIETNRGPDIPISSVEGRESQSPTTEQALFDTSAQENHRAESLPPNTIPSRLQTSSILPIGDCSSSAASSPSGAYAGLSIDSDKGGEFASNKNRRRFTSEPVESEQRGKSSRHRAIMGGAEDIPQRSSSPLKRPASELETDVLLSSQKEDVDMVMVPTPEEDTEITTAAPTAIRATSIDMLRDEPAVVEAIVREAPAAENGSISNQVPSIDVQVSTVTTVCRAENERQLSEGDKRYLVSRKWLERVTSRTSDAKAKSKEALDEEIGPIDNSNIIQNIIPQPGREDFVRLKHGVGEEFFELFPNDAWELVLEWYGLKNGTKAIVRFAHNTNPDKDSDAIPNVIYEYHPPVFHIHRVWSELGNKVDTATKLANPDAPVIVASRSMRMHDFLKIIKEAAGIPMSQKIRLWRVPRTLPGAEPTISTAVGTATPPSSRPGTPIVDASAISSETQDSWKKLLLDVTEFTKVERDSGRFKVEFEDSTVNENYNGRMDLDFCALGDDQALVIDELVEGKEGYVSNTKPSPNGKLNGAGRKGNSSFIVSSQNNSGRSSPAPSPSSGYNLRSSNRRSKNGRMPGTVGLSNLGNTCYMNSALQCVRSVEELTKYFLGDKYKEELNGDNPLGHGGAVAKSYAVLLKEIYKDPASTSVQPRQFKNVIGRYATQFSGYGQQDSQEFIGFLLDGLQEDLSRVKKKPYIEKPDSTDEMIGSPEAIRDMATKVWDITKQRDDSVIADLFAGMYKSTLVCPECDKVSITFDPFNNMTLQLPIENIWSHTVIFYPLNDKPVAIVVELDQNASFATLKSFVGKKVGVPVDRLFACEEFQGKFFKWYFDHQIPSETNVVGNNDQIMIYELEATPTNLPKPQKVNHNAYGNNDIGDEEFLPWDSPLAERLLVPVFYRRPVPEKWSRRKTWELTTAPHFIMLSPQEARSEEVIKRKVLEKIATLTTWPQLRDDDEPSSASESIDPDIVITTGSDADSSGDSKFVAHSLDGEDELVDVAMKDPNSVHESVENRPTAPLKIFNTRRPKWLNPAVFLSGEMQNLFEVSYIAGPKGRMPTGWNVTFESGTYKKISERNPQVQQINGDDTSYGYDAIENRAGSVSSKSSKESSDDVGGLAPAPTRMNDESSDEDIDPTSPRRALPVRPAAPKSGARVGNKNKRRNHNMKTYSKKGKSALRKQPQLEVDDEQDAPDDGPLVRLGEGLVIDWNEDAWETLFAGSNDEDGGRPTFEHPPTLIDSDLISKRKARDTRRSQVITLDDCLDEFGKEEILSEMDTWYCPRCKEHRRASKKFEIWRTPDILIVHLKRFSSSGLRRDKLDGLVEFPINELDLSSRVIESQDGKEEIYDLIAIDNHHGGLGGGHYTAFAKNFVDGEWYEYNDTSVAKITNPSRMITASAYLLFYRRRSSEPLGGKTLQETVNSFDNQSSSEEDSGEGSRVAGNSSQHGSSSALKGVEPAHHQPDLPGSEDGEATKTVNPQDTEDVPPYINHIEGGDPFSDSYHSVPFHDSNVRESSEADEGIDMSSDYNNAAPNVTEPVWGWGGINENLRMFPSGTGSEAGAEAGSIDGSVGVEHGSEPSRSSLERRQIDFDDAPAEDFQEDHIPDTEHEGPNVIEVMEKIAQRKGQGFNIVGNDQEEEVEEPVIEFHIEDSDFVEDMKFL
ncbi:hypothetical protein SBOR_6374 [Sclerotinia borealis F-4128]|uniref:ubiquitinyl hydrolase 1 n=1 Tax=Sclerotinia borealis (strain F-4128) TaxID=1432307 RepID=W9CBM0_SCLBF|nr:hypothetical protein SBOR_6374 [Sclerotinia borealis F-4128]